MNNINPAYANIRQHHLFSSLDDAQFQLILAKMSTISIQNGHLLFRQGQKADYFYMVVTGNIKLFLESPNGDQKIIEIIQPGQTFAEAVMFMQKNQYPVYAGALRECTLYGFQSQSFIATIKNNPQVSMNLLASLSQKLHRMLGEIESLALENATHRLIRYLLKHINKHENDSAKLQLSISKQALASRLSIQPETLSRMIKHLSDSGILIVDGRTIEINSVERLRNL